jgi:hypothetical protein
MPTIRAAAIEREIVNLLTNRKHYRERGGWTYLLKRQGPKGRVEFKIGKADNVDKHLPAYTKCGGICAVCAWYTCFLKKIGEPSTVFRRAGDRPYRTPPHSPEIAQAGCMARTPSLSRALWAQSPRMVPAFEGRRIEEGEAIGGAVFGARG